MPFESVDSQGSSDGSSCSTRASIRTPSPCSSRSPYEYSTSSSAAQDPLWGQVDHSVVWSGQEPQDRSDSYSENVASQSPPQSSAVSRSLRRIGTLASLGRGKSAHPTDGETRSGDTSRTSGHPRRLRLYTDYSTAPYSTTSASPMSTSGLDETSFVNDASSTGDISPAETYDGTVPRSYLDGIPTRIRGTRMSPIPERRAVEHYSTYTHPSNENDASSHHQNPSTFDKYNSIYSYKREPSYAWHSGSSSSPYASNHPAIHTALTQAYDSDSVLSVIETEEPSPRASSKYSSGVLRSKVASKLQHFAERLSRATDTCSASAMPRSRYHEHQLSARDQVDRTLSSINSRLSRIATSAAESGWRGKAARRKALFPGVKAYEGV